MNNNLREAEKQKHQAILEKNGMKVDLDTANNKQEQILN